MSVSRPRLGSFKLLHELGRGGMAEVWLGRDARGQTAALKLVHAPAAAAGAELDEALQREIQAVGRLDHPHIVSLFDFGTVSAEAAAQVEGWSAGSTWFAMEHAAGGTLTPERVGRWSDLRRYLLEVLEALAHAHARDIVHRDLKPDNVLLAVDEAGAQTVRLTDFGIAYAVDHSLTVDTRRIAARAAGTPYTMAPEQILGRWRDYGPWTDLYALGITAWEWATGSPPFVADSVIALARAHLVEPLPPLEPRFPVPPGFGAWLERLLAKRVSHRLQLAPDAAAALYALPPLSVDELGRVALPSTVALGHRQTWVGATTPEHPPLLERPRTSVERVVGSGDDWPPFPPHWLETTHAGGARPNALATREMREPRVSGRVRERDLLWQHLGEVHATATPRIAIVRGSAGMGKTRLARWLVERALEVGAAWNLCVRYTAVAGALDGIAPAIQRLFVCGGLEGDALRDRLRVVLAVRGGAPEDVVARDAELIAALLEDSGQSTKVGYGALARLFVSITAHRPAVIWIDDAQWGADALSFVETLIETGVSVLVLLTVRDEALLERPVENAVVQLFERRPETRVLRLGPFGHEDATEMVESLAPLDAAARARLVERSEGLPLVAIQLLEHWLERGALEERDGVLYARPGAENEIPTTTRALWSARVTQVVEGRSLPGAARVQLELAAVLGRTVSREEWRAAVCSAGLTFDPSLLPALERARLATSTRDEMAIAHGLLREHILDSARAAGRIEGHHRVCAQAIAQCHGPARNVAHRRGEHLRLSGALAASVGWLITGLQHLTATRRARVALAEAARLRRLFEPLEGSVRTRAMADLDVAEARNAYLLGDLALALARIETACASAGSIGDPDLLAEAWIWSGRVREAMADGAGAGEAYARGLEVARDAAIARQIVRAHSGLATLAFRSGRLEESLAHTEAVESLGYEGYELAGVRRARINVLISLGRGDEARALASRLVAVHSAEVVHQHTLASLHNELAELDRMEGNLESALERYQLAERAFEGLMSRDRWTARLNIGLVHLARADFAAAATTFAALIPRFDDARMRFHGALARLGWCRAVFAQPDPPATAADVFASGLEALVASGFADPDAAATVEAVGNHFVACGDVERAHRALDVARRQWRRLTRVDAVDRVEAQLASLGPPDDR